MTTDKWQRRLELHDKLLSTSLDDFNSGGHENVPPRGGRRNLKIDNNMIEYLENKPTLTLTLVEMNGQPRQAACWRRKLQVEGWMENFTR